MSPTVISSHHNLLQLPATTVTSIVTSNVLSVEVSKMQKFKLKTKLDTVLYTKAFCTFTLY